MINKYYGVASTPNEDFLAHYGVRGMKWGVRKAIERGSDRKLSRQFNKAQKKLLKLEQKANLKAQANIAASEAKRQKTSRRVGEAGLALGAGYTAGALASGVKKAVDMAKKTGRGSALVNITPGLALGAAGVGSLINKSIHKHRKHQAQRLMTTEGHAKAVAKRDEFKREMKNAFAGTKYSSNSKVLKNNNKTTNPNAERNLRRATAAGGIIGGLAYAGTHRDQFSSQKKKRRK